MILIDDIENYDLIAWSWFALCLIWGAKVSGHSREQKDKDFEELLVILGMTEAKKRKSRKPIGQVNE